MTAHIRQILYGDLNRKQRCSIFYNAPGLNQNAESSIFAYTQLELESRLRLVYKCCNFNLISDDSGWIFLSVFRIVDLS
jgi:hypothetical protein